MDADKTDDYNKNARPGFKEYPLPPSLLQNTSPTSNNVTYESPNKADTASPPSSPLCRPVEREKTFHKKNNVLSNQIPKQYSMIHSWCALFLSSFLAFFSALDATSHCKDMFGDESSSQAENEVTSDEYMGKCLLVFKSKILLPSLTGMFLSGFVVTSLVRYHGSKELKAPLMRAKRELQKRLKATTTSQLQMQLRMKIEEVSSNIHLQEIEKKKQERREQSLTRKRAPLMGFLAFLCTVVWGIQIFSMMLHSPWRCQGKECSMTTGFDDDDDLTQSDDKVDEIFRSGREDELETLGAVNSKGEVGSNANLFYACWASFGLSVALCFGFTFSPFLMNTYNNKMCNAISELPSIYRFRERMSTWIAMTVCCVIVLVGSTRLWRVLVAYREYSIGKYSIAHDDDTVSLSELVNEEDLWQIIMENDDNPYYGNFLPEMFARTKLAVIMGLFGTFISSVATVAHWTTHSTSFVSCTFPFALFLELILSLVQSTFFGFVGWYVTGTGGPAQSVGNLYYAIMSTFVLSLRILVGCIEEFIQAHEPYDKFKKRMKRHMKRAESMQYTTTCMCPTPDPLGESSSTYSKFMTPPPKQHNSSKPTPSSQESKSYPVEIKEDEPSTPRPPEKAKELVHRPGDMRKWGAICMFSSVQLGSVIDGLRYMDFDAFEYSAYYEDNTFPTPLSYMVLAPTIAILISFTFFLLCLNQRTYNFITVKTNLVLIASFITFGFWCSNLLVTMHSEYSLAINGRGEIIAANQYYFSWASCSTSFLNFLGYLRRGKPESLLAILWSAILKLSLVMVSAAVHVWHNIGDKCRASSNDLYYAEGDAYDFDEFHLKFCQRTRFSLFLGYLGFYLSALFLLLRCCVIPHFAIMELVASALLVFFFSLGTYIITGINGPGQVVGDLYYATWIIFIFTLVIGESSYDQYKELYLSSTDSEQKDDEELQKKSSSAVEDSQTSYVMMEIE